MIDKAINKLISQSVKLIGAEMFSSEKDLKSRGGRFEAPMNNVGQGWISFRQFAFREERGRNTIRLKSRKRLISHRSEFLRRSGLNAPEEKRNTEQAKSSTRPRRTRTAQLQREPRAGTLFLHGTAELPGNLIR